MSLQELVSVSKRYGADPEYVMAGGGNTSWKNEGELYIKASGVALESITESGFVKMDRKKLAAIWSNTYPADSAAREKAVLADMMASRCAGEESKRPSVETLLHDILPYAFVVHTHPALVNAITCSARQEKAAQELFGDEVLWIPSTNPGYILSRIVKDAFDTYRKKKGVNPGFILLQNHGIFVAADTVAEIETIYARVMNAIDSKIKRRPDFGGAVDKVGPSDAAARTIAALASESYGDAGNSPDAVGTFLVNNEIRRTCSGTDTFAVMMAPFTPDHIVYAGSDPLWVDAGADPGAPSAMMAVESSWRQYVSQKKRTPKLVAIRGLGVFGVGANEKSARLAIELFLDAVKIAVYAESFGGGRAMTQDQIDFINNWEVESYRSKISTSGK